MKPKAFWPYLRISLYFFSALVVLSPTLWLGWRALVPGIGVLGIVICVGESMARLPRP